MYQHDHTLMQKFGARTNRNPNSADYPLMAVQPAPKFTQQTFSLEQEVTPQKVKPAVFPKANGGLVITQTANSNLQSESQRGTLNLLVCFALRVYLNLFRNNNSNFARPSIKSPKAG